MISGVYTSKTWNLCRKCFFTLHSHNMILTTFLKLNFRVLHLHNLKFLPKISLHTTLAQPDFLYIRTTWFQEVFFREIHQNYRSWRCFISSLWGFLLSSVVFAASSSSLLLLLSSDPDLTLTSSFCNWSPSQLNSSKPLLISEFVCWFPSIHLTPLVGVINLRSSFSFFGLCFFLELITKSFYLFFD